MADKKKMNITPERDPWKILMHPLLTEKVIGKIEKENKLVFIVRRNSTKKQIRWAIETALDVEVEKLQTMIDPKGRKKAFIRLKPKYSASDIATRFGML